MHLLSGTGYLLAYVQIPKSVEEAAQLECDAILFKLRPIGAAYRKKRQLKWTFRPRRVGTRNSISVKFGESRSSVKYRETLLRDPITRPEGLNVFPFTLRSLSKKKTTPPALLPPADFYSEITEDAIEYISKNSAKLGDMISAFTQSGSSPISKGR
ncbi:hypothetical protein EVAR_97766_1 [Eumeta japonica]|uniref:Uncharacterized protein n=1 Tax=Eumeta variegata TaxID=151549 RepID=A0A4C1Y8N0_EUMVA|nr:hypothetical protein EVAR_97766_1 [Eumeta japonica]